MFNFRNIFILVILLTGIIVLQGCTSNAQEIKTSTKTSVEIAKVQLKELSVPIRVSGILSAATESKLSFKIPGIVDRVPVEEGQFVRKGTILAILNQREISARVQQARSGEEKAQRDLRRAKQLFADSVATLEQLQNATTALEIAKSELEIAEFNMQHSKIIAPADGKVLRRFVEKGELVGAGMPIFFFGSIKDNWVIKAGVSDKDIIRLRVNDSAEISFDIYPDQIYTARVSEIAAAANPLTGTFEIELKLVEQPKTLFSGLIGKAKIIPQKTQLYSVVPVESFLEGNGMEGYVFQFVRNEDIVKKTKIKVAYILDTELAVTSGLENVQYVVTHGSSYLTDNSSVQVIN